MLWSNAMFNVTAKSSMPDAKMSTLTVPVQLGFTVLRHALPESPEEEVNLKWGFGEDEPDCSARF
jgi:hypothetical protein